MQRCLYTGTMSNNDIELPFCDECREGRGFIHDGVNSGWCGDCFGGHVDDEMYDAIREANEALDAIEDACEPCWAVVASHDAHYDYVLSDGLTEADARELADSEGAPFYAKPMTEIF